MACGFRSAYPFIFIRQTVLLLLPLLLELFCNTTVTQTIVETLPGYSGPLPFKLETGYIGVGESEDVQLFYYFIESESDPMKDPLLLWLTGGPGCSAFSGLVYEIGPLKFNFQEFDGSQLPSLLLNPYSWTKVASIIFLDAPQGTGFSYATIPEKFHSSDLQTVEDISSFLRKWLSMHPNFIKNRLYIAGDSYAGKWVPMVAWNISEGNDAKLEPRMNLEGYIIGNPLTDKKIDSNSRLPYAHRMALISDKYYEMAKNNCRGNYADPDPQDAWCLLALQHYEECIENIFKGNILEPVCKFRSPKPKHLQFMSEILIEDDESMRIIWPLNQERWCRNDGYVLSKIWANDPIVQETLNIRKGKVEEWIRCNQSLDFDKNVDSVVHYHRLLCNKEYQALVYSGDHDLVIPYMGTLEWISQLNLTIDDDWRQWNVDGQVAGYTERYEYNDRFYLIFATVKGAGHTAPEYKGKECLAMLGRFLSYYPL